jgi:hypothetical protein
MPNLTKMCHEMWTVWVEIHLLRRMKHGADRTDFTGIGTGFAVFCKELPSNV